MLIDLSNWHLIKLLEKSNLWLGINTIVRYDELFPTISEFPPMNIQGNYNIHIISR